MRDGDVIISTVRTYLKAVAPIKKPEPNLIVSTGFAVVRPKADLLCPAYAGYLLLSEPLLGEIVSRSVGVSYPAVNPENIGDLEVEIPSLPIQNAISSYLDKETARIDALIVKKERQIDLLQEKRQAIITQAVTKGLNHNAKMKDSGVEWIGEIPEGWQVIKIRHLSIVKRGASPRPIDDPQYFNDDGEYSWVRISDVTSSNKYLEETEQKLSPLGKSLSVPLSEGDLFLSIAGSVGKPIITKIKCCIHDGFVYFSNFNQNREFLYYIFLSRQPFGGLGKMGTQLNLNTDTVGDIRIPCPSVLEQEKIVEYIIRETRHIDELSGALEDSIALLREYRSALITAAVSGQIDVTQEVKQ